jgi:hypothetical protein
VTQLPVRDSKPRELQVQRITVCFSQPRRCEIVKTLHCATRGWSSSVEPTLFTPDEHTADEGSGTRRSPARRTTPQLLAAGLPGLISPEDKDDQAPPP